MFSIFPWENNIKPYFVNEEGFEWYIDEEMTEYARKKDPRNGNEGLKGVVCFFVKKGDFITRTLIDEHQHILHDDQSLEGMATKIDLLKFALK